MLAACFLIVIATMSGTLLTFLYDRVAPFPARLCMGAVTGLAFLTVIGFLFSLWLGLTGASVVLAALALLLPLLFFLRPEFRSRVATQTGAAIRPLTVAFRRPTREGVARLVFYIGLAILLGAVFARAVYATPYGIFTGVRNNLGDLPLHLQVINSFTQGHNLPPEDPTFAGVRFAYPFMVDFLTAMLVRGGAEVIAAMWIQNMVLALALAGLLHYWTLLLTRDQLAGLIAPLLVFFSGGLGWIWFLDDLYDSSSGLIALLSSQPRSYTIMDSGILRWGNSLTTLFVPQRSILFGMPLAVCIFVQWWQSIAGRSKTAGAHSSANGRMIFAGSLAGLLPLIHAHTFLVVMGVAACLMVIFGTLWRQWALFFVAALVVALPQLWWLAGAGGVKARSYLGWHIGWQHENFNPILFWLANTGLFIPLLLLAVLLWRRSDGPPKAVLMFYAPFAFCFIVPNVIKLAPWIWDNIKVLFWWYAASAPLVAWLLARGLRQRSFWRWLSASALVALLLAGALDVLGVVTGSAEYQEFDSGGVAIAQTISRGAAPRAVVLHAPVYNSPVFLTGRRSLLGYPGWMWSRGLDDSARHADIARMYAGAPDAETLLRRYQVEYVLIGPAETSSLKVNQPFWSGYSKTAEIGEYSLYKTSTRGERADQ